jgi:hypothetical protein
MVQIIIYDINDVESSSTLKQGNAIFECTIMGTGKSNLKTKYKGEIVDPEFVKLVDIAKDDFELIIKNIPKYKTKYEKQKDKIRKAKETFETYTTTPKVGAALTRFLESTTSILYINPFDRYENEKNWKVLDFNLPFIDTRENISKLINKMISELTNAITPSSISTTLVNKKIDDYMPANIKQILKYYNVSVDFGKIEKQNSVQKIDETNLLNNIQYYKLPYKFEDNKIKSDSTKGSTIIEIIYFNKVLIKELIHKSNNANIRIDNNYYNIMGLYLYNTCHIYIEIMLYTINKCIKNEQTKKNNNLYLYLIKYIKSVENLRVIIRNAFYTIFPPITSTAKYNIQLTNNKKVSVIGNVNVISEDKIKKMYPSKEANIEYDYFLNGSNNIKDEYDKKKYLSAGGFKIENININPNNTIVKIEDISIKVEGSINVELEPKEEDDKNLQNNIKVIDELIKSIKMGIEDKTRNKLYDKISTIEKDKDKLNARIPEFKGLFENNIQKSLDNLLFILNFRTNSLNTNYNAKNKLIESIDEAKLLANYYYYNAYYILINLEKYVNMKSELRGSMPKLVKEFIDPCKKYELKSTMKLNREIENIDKKTEEIKEQNRNNKGFNFNVTNYTKEEFWNRVQNIIKGRELYVPVEQEDDVYLLPIIESCKMGKIVNKSLVSATKYFYTKFRDNIILLSEEKSLFSNSSSIRYLPNSVYDELYDSNINKLRKTLFEILSIQSKYTESTKKFKGTDAFVDKLIKENKELGLSSLLDNNQQIIAVNQTRAMIRSLL